MPVLPNRYFFSPVSLGCLMILLLWIINDVAAYQPDQQNAFKEIKIWKTTSKEAIPDFNTAPYKISSTNALAEETSSPDDYYWVRVQQFNSNEEKLKQYLIADNPMVGEITLFKLENDLLTKLFKTGDNYPFSQRPVLRRNFVFPIVMAPKSEETYVFKIYNEGRRVYLPIYSTSPENYEYKEQSVISMLMIIYGILLAIALVAFIMFFFLKVYSLLLLSGLVFSIFMVLILASGIGFQFIVPESPALYNRLQHASLYFASFFVQLYAYSYLKRYLNGLPTVKLIFTIQVSLIFVMGTLVFLNSFFLNFFTPVVYYIAIISFLFALIAGFYVIIKNLGEAIYYLVAVFFGILGSTAYYFNLVRPFADGNVLTSPFHVGTSAMFLFLLLLAELERVRVLRKNREDAMKELAFLYEEKKQAAASLEKEVLITQRELEKEKKVAGLAVLKGEEQERQRIARELHDGIGSLLTVLRLQLDLLSSGHKPDDDFFIKTISNSNKLLDTAYEELKSITERVLPTVLQHFGLIKAIKDLARQVNNGQRIKLHINIPDDLPELPETVEHAIYRIVLEITTNMLKHAEASSGEITIQKDDEFIIIKGTDNGKGLDVNKSGMGSGLKNMRNRAVALGGKFDIYSTIGNGTSILVKIPVNHE